MATKKKLPSKANSKSGKAAAKKPVRKILPAPFVNERLQQIVKDYLDMPEDLRASIEKSINDGIEQNAASISLEYGLLNSPEFNELKKELKLLDNKFTHSKLQVPIVVDIDFYNYQPYDLEYKASVFDLTGYYNHDLDITFAIIDKSKEFDNHCKPFLKSRRAILNKMVAFLKPLKLKKKDSLNIIFDELLKQI